MSAQQYLYSKIYNDLKRRIEDGSLQEGKKLPKEEELLTQYKVSAITLKRAITMLKEEGLVQRVRGVGTYVKRAEKNNEQEQDGMQFATPTIGLVMEYASSSFGLDLLYQLDKEAGSKGYRLIVRFSYFDRKKEMEEIDFLLKSGVTGLIVMPCHGVYYNTCILKLILEGYPIVVIDKKMEDITIPSVRTDNKGAVKRLVKRMKESGCRSLGFISPEIGGTSSIRERRDGFYEGAAEQKIRKLSECNVIFDKLMQATPLEENVKTMTEYLIRQKGHLDGIICSEYSLMPTLYEAAKKSNTDLYNEVQVCYIDGPLTEGAIQMKQNEAEIAKKSIELILLQKARSENKETSSFEGEIVIPAILLEG